MNAESVKARLKNFAVSSGCTFQEALVYSGLDRKTPITMDTGISLMPESAFLSFFVPIRIQQYAEKVTEPPS